MPRKIADAVRNPTVGMIRSSILPPVVKIYFEDRTLLAIGRVVDVAVRRWAEWASEWPIPVGILQVPKPPMLLDRERL